MRNSPLSLSTAPPCFTTSLCLVLLSYSLFCRKFWIKEYLLGSNAPRRPVGVRCGEWWRDKKKWNNDKLLLPLTGADNREVQHILTYHSNRISRTVRPFITNPNTHTTHNAHNIHCTNIQSPSVLSTSIRSEDVVVSEDAPWAVVVLVLVGGGGGGGGDGVAVSVLYYCNAEWLDT